MPLILIVDDIEEYLKSLERFLRKDFRIITAVSLNEAKDKATIESVDVALVDVRLNEEDSTNREGLQFLQWMREHKSNVPVIIMSAYRDFNSAIDALNLGAKHFLKKPINISELQDILKNILSQEPKST